MKYQESKLAHAYLDGLCGLEIGGSAHNSFGLNTRNVDYSASTSTAFKQEEVVMCGDLMHVDIVAPGDNILVPDESEDFIINSHVIEHFPDPIKALKEWYRIVKRGGYIYIIAPHKERTFDKNRSRTTLQELIERHESTEISKVDPHVHYSVWITEDLVELITYLGWKISFVQDIDDKVGNGFVVVIQKNTQSNLNIDIDLHLKRDLFEYSDILFKDAKSIEKIIGRIIADSKKQHVMENSKFWKLRGMYLSFKEFFIANRKDKPKFRGKNI
ncbi:MAG: class I SAM-dependent methyltransferase [Minisyncoccota bacterium]